MQEQDPSPNDSSLQFSGHSDAIEPANDPQLKEPDRRDNVTLRSRWLEKQQRHFRLSMTFKVSLWFGIPLIAGFIALFKLVHDSQYQFQSEQVGGFAQFISEQLAASAVEPLFADAHMELSVLIQQFPLRHSLVGIAVYDHTGRIVARNGWIAPETAYDINRPISSVSKIWMQNKTNDTSTLPDLYVQKASIYSTPIVFRGVTGGHAIIIFDKSSLEAQLEQTQYALLSIALFLIMFLAVVVFYFSHRITAPIRQIVDAANRIDAGDISPILERRNDELGQLINAINNMTRGLAEKSQIKEVLDRFVDSDISNKILSQIDSVDLKGENVEATVLFADIVGFTSMSEQLEPDRVSELLNEYFDYYSACAKLYFGKVDKFLGDCIMIVFGASREDQQHQYHALCCALLMQELTEKINQLRTRQGMDTIKIRIGINSGKMLAGLLGSRDRLEYTVVGDSVNLASRLCNEAQAGEIIVQDSLCQSLQEQYPLKLGDHRTIKVRGKSEPVAIYNLLGIEQQRTSGNRAMIDDLLEKASGSLTPI